MICTSLIINILNIKNETVPLKHSGESFGTFGVIRIPETSMLGHPFIVDYTSESLGFSFTISCLQLNKTKLSPSSKAMLNIC